MHDHVTHDEAPFAPLADVERQHISAALARTRGNKRRAARILGISRWALARRLRKFGEPASVRADAAY